MRKLMPLLRLVSVFVLCGLLFPSAPVQALNRSGRPDPNPAGMPSGKTPVVFVHGWLGLGFPLGCSASDRTRQTDGDVANHFEQVDDLFLADDRFAVFYAHLVSNACFTPPLDENVPYLRQAIEQARAATGRSQVILVTHSMGGLVSRAYIEGPDYAGDVQALFTFGSPHQGVPLDLLAFLFNGISLGAICRDIQPVICDLTTAGMRAFNLDHRPRPGVAYHLISGDAPLHSRNALGWITAALIPGPDDGIVSTASGTGLAGEIDRLVTDENHGSFSSLLTRWTYYGIRRTPLLPDTYSKSFTACLQPVLMDGERAACALPSGSPPQGLQAAEISFTGRTPVRFERLQAGQTAREIVDTASGPVQFAAAWQGGEFELTLVDPLGQIIDPRFAGANPEEVTYQSDGLNAVYSFADAQPGAWQMQLQALSASPGGSDTAMLATFASQPDLDGGLDRPWYSPGVTATITATLREAATAAVIATIVRPDGVVETLPLSPAGEGTFEAAYTVPDTPGYAELRLSATGTLATDQPFTRAKSEAFQIAPQTIALSGPVHETALPGTLIGDGYTALEITVGVSVAASGKYGLSGDLLDSSGEFVAHSLAIQTLAPGSQSLALRFAGQEIFTSQRNGPYRLTNLTLTDRSHALLIAAEAADLHTTAPYRASDFRLAGSYLPLLHR